MIYMKWKYIDVSFYFAKSPGLKNMQMLDLIFLSWAQIKASLCTQKKVDFSWSLQSPANGVLPFVRWSLIVQSYCLAGVMSGK